MYELFLSLSPHLFLSPPFFPHPFSLSYLTGKPSYLVRVHPLVPPIEYYLAIEGEEHFAFETET